MQDRDSAFRSMMSINLSLITQFHNHMNAFLKEKHIEIEEVDTLDKHTKRYWQENYKNHFPQKLRETVFLLIFGHLEETLILLHSIYNPFSSEMDRGMGLARFKTYIKSLLSEDFSRSSDYQLIRNAQLVRNALLHMSGRISLSKDRDQLERLVNKHPAMFSSHMDRVTITLAGLKSFQEAVYGLTETVLNKALQRNGV